MASQKIETFTKFYDEQLNSSKLNNLTYFLKNCKNFTIAGLHDLILFKPVTKACQYSMSDS